MQFKTEDAVRELADARVTLGIGYGQSVAAACLALITRLAELGEHHAAQIARDAVRHQSGVTSLDR